MSYKNAQFKNAKFYKYGSLGVIVNVSVLNVDF